MPTFSALIYLFWISCVFEPIDLHSLLFYDKQNTYTTGRTSGIFLRLFNFCTWFSFFSWNFSFFQSRWCLWLHCICFLLCIFLLWLAVFRMASKCESHTILWLKQHRALETLPHSRRWVSHMGDLVVLVFTVVSWSMWGWRRCMNAESSISWDSVVQINFSPCRDYAESFWSLISNSLYFITYFMCVLYPLPLCLL